MSFIDTDKNKNLSKNMIASLSNWAEGSVWPVLTKEEALRQANAEGLTLSRSKNTTGYKGVIINNPGSLKPYLARIGLYGKAVHIGHYATPEQAALMFARAKAKVKAAGWVDGRGRGYERGAMADSSATSRTSGRGRRRGRAVSEEDMVILDAVEVDEEAEAAARVAAAREAARAGSSFSWIPSIYNVLSTAGAETAEEARRRRLSAVEAAAKKAAEEVSAAEEREAAIEEMRDRLNQVRTNDMQELLNKHEVAKNKVARKWENNVADAVRRVLATRRAMEEAEARAAAAEAAAAEEEAVAAAAEAAAAEEEAAAAVLSNFTNGGKKRTKIKIQKTKNNKYKKHTKKHNKKHSKKYIKTRKFNKKKY